MTAEKLEIIKKDRMRYKSNALSSNLCLLGLVVNVFYFVVVYTINNSNLYMPLLGASIVYNLLFMLVAFLSSTKVKAYDWKFGVVVLVLAALQIPRIFWLPMVVRDIGTPVVTDEVFDVVTRMIVYLSVSSAFLVASGVTAILRSQKRTKFLKQVELGEIDLSFLHQTEGGN